jgi:hypothetical protein
MVGPLLGSARRQVSDAFLHLDKFIAVVLLPAPANRSHGLVFSQVRRPEIREPCSRL